MPLYNWKLKHKEAVPDDVLPGRVYLHAGDSWRSLHPWVLFNDDGVLVRQFGSPAATRRATFWAWRRLTKTISTRTSIGSMRIRRALKRGCSRACTHIASPDCICMT